MRLTHLAATGLALTAGLALSAGAASASVVTITIDWTGGPTETLTLNSTTGVVDALDGFNSIAYPTLTDNQGNSGIAFGDGSSLSGIVETGTFEGCCGYVIFTRSAQFSTAFYTQFDTQADFIPGTYVSPTGLATMTISVAGTPEPAAWALMLIGFAGLGATLRQRRVQIHT